MTVKKTVGKRTSIQNRRRRPVTNHAVYSDINSTHADVRAICMYMGILTTHVCY